MSMPEPPHKTAANAALNNGRLEWRPAEIAAYRNQEGLQITFTLWEDDSGQWEMMDGRNEEIRRYPSKESALAAAARLESDRDRPPPVIAESALAALAD